MSPGRLCRPATLCLETAHLSQVEEHLKALKDADMPSLPGLPPFAPVSASLLDLLSREDAVVAQVAELLRLDREFVAEVLRLSGTRLFGFERQIRTLAHAVTRLGPRRLKALAVTVRHQAHGPLRGYWRHNVASGFLAAHFAAARGEGPAFRPWAALEPAIPADGSTVHSLTDMVEAACSAEALRQLPQSVWSEPERLARALEEIAAVINN